MYACVVCLRERVQHSMNRHSAAFHRRFGVEFFAHQQHIIVAAKKHSADTHKFSTLTVPRYRLRLDKELASGGWRTGEERHLHARGNKKKSYSNVLLA